MKHFFFFFRTKCAKKATLRWSASAKRIRKTYIGGKPVTKV